MTQTKKIVILDANSTRVIFTTCEHNPSDDLDVAVGERLEELGLKENEVVWQEIASDTEIETDYPLQMIAVQYN